VTRVFVYQEELDALRQRWRPGDPELSVDALGMAMDDGDVFHIYLQAPRPHFAGEPCRARVTLSGAPVAAPFGDDSPRVVVAVSPDDGVSGLVTGPG
jgi:hypothetical protein